MQIQNIISACSSRVFVDADEYQSSIRGGDNLLTFLAGGVFRAELTTIQVGKLTLQRGRENLPRLATTSMPPNIVGILGWLGDGAFPVVRGVQIRQGEWMSLGLGMQSHHRTAGPVNYVALTINSGDLAQAAIDQTGIPVSVTGGKVLRVPEYLGAWLMSVIDAASRAVETTAGIFASPLAADALEHALLRPMIMCLMHGETVAQDIPGGRGAAVAKRFEEVVEAHLEGPLMIPDLCRTIGVSQRTLSNICQEQLGVSPLRFMTLRRLHMTRRMLLRADPRSTTVTQIAMDNGFWEMGRFAATYKSLFEESPSATLRRPPADMAR